LRKKIAGKKDKPEKFNPDISFDDIKEKKTGWIKKERNQGKEEKRGGGMLLKKAVKGKGQKGHQN
jgi:hypothetical protein